MNLPKEVEMRFVLMRLDIQKGMTYKQKFGIWPKDFKELIQEFDDYLRSIIPLVIECQDTEREKSQAADELLDILTSINKAIN